MAVSTEEKKKENTKQNFWGMMEKVLISSLIHGQFLVGCAFFVVIVFLIRLSSGDVFKVFDETFNWFKTTSAIGWTLWIITVLASIILYKRAQNVFNYDRKSLRDKIEKLEKEKGDLIKKIPSSKR